MGIFQEVRISSPRATVDVTVPPNEIWQLIGGFGSLPDWVPGVLQSKLADGGRVRYLHDAQGHTFIERLEHYDAAAHSYAYSILHSPISVSDYLSMITVTLSTKVRDPISIGRASTRRWGSVRKKSKKCFEVFIWQD